MQPNATGRPVLPVSILVCCAIAILAADAAGVLLDDFTDGELSISVTGNQVHMAQINLDPDSVIDRQRNIELWGNTGTATLDIDTADGGTLTFSALDGGITGYLTLEYGSADDPLNLDMTALGHDALRIRYRLAGYNGTFGVPAWFRPYGNGDQVHLDFGRTVSDQVRTLVMPLNYTENNDLSDIDSFRIEIIRMFEGVTIELLDIATTLDHSVHGDFNADGTTDAQDFEILSQNFGRSVSTPQHGDANHDRKVTLDDFGILAMHFGQTHLTPGESPPATLPEPAAAALLLGALLLGRRPTV